MMDNMVDLKKNLRLGIEAARVGQGEKAKQYLAAVLKQDRNNIPALFWLAFVAPSPQESLRLLERVLTLDPDNERARAGIRWAEKRLEAEKAQPEPEPEAKVIEPEPETERDTTEVTPAQTDEDSPELPDEFIRDQLLSQEEFQKRAQKGALAHRARRTIDPLLMVVIILGAAAFLTIGIWALALTPAKTLAAWLPGPAESAPTSTGAVEFVPVAKSAPLVEEAAPIKQSASAGDTIVIETAESDMLSLPDVPLAWEAPLAPEAPPTPEAATEPVTITEETSEPVSEGLILPAEPATEPNTTAGETPAELIGPVDETSAGPKLFEPVDESLLAHQPASPGEKWIEVDVTTQQVTAWEGNVPVMVFTVSTGVPGTPTVLGEFNIYWKLESTLMTGSDYYLPDVPYTMYFYRGYALHGTYWHDNFGQQMSRGCVNLSIDDAKQLFEWADPLLPPDQTQVTSTYNAPGTLVVVHQ